MPSWGTAVPTDVTPLLRPGVRSLAACALALALAACSSPTSEDGGPSDAAGGPATGATPSASSTSTPGGSDDATAPGAGTSPEDGSGERATWPDDTDSDDEQDPGDRTDTVDEGDDGGGGDGGLEMPTELEADDGDVSLSELLTEIDDSPLVSAPLPRPASARGRLVRGYPAALRPPRASRVQSSSVSPSGDRLQVGLVGSSSLSSDQLLLAYRTRLSHRGMTERTPPATAPGTSAASFRRGRSVVTLTVTDGPRTSYALHATLLAGRR